MVFLQNFTTNQIDSLPSTGGLLIYDTDLNILKFRDNTGTAQVLHTSSDGTLSLSNDGTNELLELDSTTTTGTTTINFNTNGQDWIIGGRGSANSTLPDHFFIYDSTTASMRLTIDSAGSVDVPVHDGNTVGLKLAGVLISSTAAEINYLDLTTGPGTAEVGKAVILDGSGDVTGINELTVTTLNATNFDFNGEVSALNEGEIIIRSYSGPDMDGRMIQNEVITSINLTDYNPNGQTDNFGIEIVGYIKPLYSENYNFKVTSNDKVRLWVNNTKIYHNWVAGSVVDVQGNSVSLTANQWYPIYVQQTDVTGTHTLIIKWLSTSQTEEIIPASAMAWDNRENGAKRHTLVEQKLTLFSDASTTYKETLFESNSNGGLTITSDEDIELGCNGGIGAKIRLDASTNDIMLLGSDIVLIHGSSVEFAVGITGSETLSVKTLTDIVEIGGSLGINTSAPSRAIEINHATGQCLRLTYNDSDGSAINYTDFDLASNGRLDIRSSNSINLLPLLYVQIYGKLIVNSASGENIDQLRVSGGRGNVLVVDNVNDEVGINKDSNSVNKALDINSTTGNCLRLIYNNRTVSPTNYVDFLVNSSGDLSITPSGDDVDITTHDGTNGLKLGGTLVSSTAVELNYLDLTTGPGTAEGDKALVLDSSLDITGINNLSATNLTGTLQTAAQTNITSIGSLSELIIVGDDAVGNTSLYPFLISRTTSATPAINLGVGMEFGIENSVNTVTVYGSLEVSATDITDTTEDGFMEFKLMSAGTLVSRATLDNTGDFSAVTLTETSDKRVKENIIQVDNKDSYDKIKQLNIVDYNFIQDEDKRKHRGIIAQELLEVIPTAVHIKSNTEYNGISNLHTVSNKELTGHLLSAFQYLSSKVEKLESDNKYMKEKLDNL